MADATRLLALRSEVDDIDAQVIALLGRRFGVTRDIGGLKARAGLSAVDSDREARQVARYRMLASEADLDPDLVVALFRRVIDEVVKEHRGYEPVRTAPYT